MSTHKPTTLGVFHKNTLRVWQWQQTPNGIKINSHIFQRGSQTPPHLLFLPPIEHTLINFTMAAAKNNKPKSKSSLAIRNIGHGLWLYDIEGKKEERRQEGKRRDE